MGNSKFRLQIRWNAAAFLLGACLASCNASGASADGGTEPEFHAELRPDSPSVVAAPLLASAAGPAAESAQSTAGGAAEEQSEPGSELEAVFRSAGIELDLTLQALSIPAEVLIKEDLIEYLLVAPQGSAHESLFTTTVQPSLLNTALLSLGVERGKNARWVERVPAPTPEERRNGARAVDVLAPEGDGFLLYALWREGEEIYFFRIEDLIDNLRRNRVMRRHRWVYLGSRFASDRPGGEEYFQADREGNLICVTFFGEGNVLCTAALEDCRDQSIWIANRWLLPATGKSVRFIFARERLDCAPPKWIEALPDSASYDSGSESEAGDAQSPPADETGGEESDGSQANGGSDSGQSR